MTTRMEHHVTFAHSPARVFAAITDRNAIEVRLAELGGVEAALVEYHDEHDQVRFSLRQGISAEQLPPAVRALHQGDLIVHREQTWTKNGEIHHGTATATVSGVPANITARTSLNPINTNDRPTPESDGKSDSEPTHVAGSETHAELHTIGEIVVRIPFLGGPIEKTIAAQVTALLEKEAALTTQWLAHTP